MIRQTELQSQVYQRLKNGIDVTLYYKVRIKGKVEQSRERSSALPYTSV